MKSNKLKIGLQVKTMIDKEAYYGGIIPKGSVGIIGAINCPYVTRNGVFQCVDFIVNDVKKRASYHATEIKCLSEEQKS